MAGRVGGVVVAHSGVHQAFQIALAAQEAGLLDVFYCSLFDAPGKWGRWLRLCMGENALTNRRCRVLDSTRIAEIPLPFLLNRLADRLSLADMCYSRLKLKRNFDLQVAHRVRECNSRLFIGVEGCARDSFRAAGEQGMIKVLDCPQVHPRSLSRLLSEAADDLGVPPPPPFDSAEMTARKTEEYQMADLMLVISKVHRRSFLEAGFSENRLVEIPLWVDPELWFPTANVRKANPSSPLTALFVGSIGFRKGIPYLIRAVEKCGDKVRLVLVGVDKGETNRFVRQSPADIHYEGRKSKAQLRQIYWQADVVVLPSLIDTFGFVAMEAMACGLPVSVTENCGVPVPDEQWRVPVMDSHSIAQRLMLYAEDRDLCRSDGKRAAQFAQGFTPEQYREQIKALCNRLLKTGNL
jgi:glycosyltransferase involved in cell wall biosynthesis